MSDYDFSGLYAQPGLMKLTIGHLAKQANVTIETIRYYQRIGLLIEPQKPLAGYREYPREAITRLGFIKRAQQSGFTLKEISELLSLDAGHCDDVRKMAEQKYQQINHKIEDLSALQRVLEQLIRDCQNDQSPEHCSLIDSFSGQINKHT
ncbi:MAG TPA: MerR family transcriptional regulator [Crenotrichaceae bacterium]|nr:MerR family transcriptional regulator [Crenotrichaceae bacterium]